MRNLSKKAQQAMESRRDFYASAEITFADGTKKTLGRSGFALSGNTVIDSAESNSFPLGILASKRVTLSLMNDDDRWSEYDFYGAKIFLQTKFDLDDGTTETLNIGTFTVVTPESYGTVISVTAMDDSYKTDKDYSTSLSFPVALGVALSDSCTSCGITQIGDVPNSDYLIPSAPENVTHRQFIGLCAMIAGGNAKFDEYNRLQIAPYDFTNFERFEGWDGGTFAPWTKGDARDGGTFNPWNDGDSAGGGQFGDRDNAHVLYEFASGMTIDVDDVVITGVQMDGKDADNNTVTHLFGEEGYVLSLDNRLAVGKEEEALKLIGAKIVGLRFRPFSGDHISLPTAEFMDLAMIVDWKQNVYQTVLTDVTFNYFGFTGLKCAADSPIRNSSKYYGREVKAIVEARQMVQKEKTERDLAVEQLANKLAHSSGLYMTAEEQEDKSTIYYMHDKPTLEESMIVWKLTAEAFGISTDGGKTYPYGLDATGVAILDRIYAIGLNADYIKTGAFEIVKDGKVMVLMDKDTGEVILRPDTFELSDGSTIGSIAEDKANTAANGALESAKTYADKTATDKANAAVNAQTQEDIFNRLTNSGESKGIILRDGQLYVSATYMQSGALRVAKNGNTLFLADIDAGRVEIVADSFSLSSGETIDSIAEKTASSIASESVTAAINNFVSSTYNPQIAELQKQLDGQIETHFYDHEPTLENEPAASWKTEDDKERHEGDLFFNRTTGYSYRFFRKGNSWGWELVQDTDVTKALAQAAQAQATADGKARVFYRTPQPPYDLYDLWAQGTGGDIMICVRARQSGDYDASDWTKSNDYIDRAIAQTITNNALSEFFESEFQPMLDALKEQADKKSENWYQEKDPLEEWIYLQDSNGNTLLDSSNGKLEDSSSSNIKKEHTNDLWYNTTEQKIYYWDGTKWNLSKTDVPDELFDKIDGKAQIFISQPTPPYQQGDLWFNSTTSDIMTCITSRETGNYTASDWQKRNKYIDQSAADKAASDAVKGQTQQDIFNKITENGTKKTFRMENGEIYLNATYMATGVLQSHDGETFYLDLDKGVLRMKATELTIEGQSVNEALSAAVTSMEQQFYSSNSATSLSGGTWGTKQPAWTQGKFIWSRQYVKYGDGSTAYLPSVNGVCITGNTGANGTNGTNGTNGVSVNSVVAQYYSHTSSTAAPSSSSSAWTTTMPTVQTGRYIWFRQRITYSDNQVSYTTPYCMTKTVGDIAQQKVDAQTQQSIFNKLTNNGKVQGIFLDSNGRIYINAQFMSIDTLSAISANLGTVTSGILQSANYSQGYGSYSDAGTQINLAGGTIKSKNFYIDSTGTAGFSGDIEASDISGSRIDGSSIYGSSFSTDNEYGYGGVEITAAGISMESDNTEITIGGYINFGAGNYGFVSGDFVEIIEGPYINTHGYGLYVDSLFVSGAKSRIISTKDYDARLQYCYEMPSPMFGDIGEAFTDENGECYIYLDDIFSETVSAQIEYQVFLQKEGPGDVWVDSKEQEFFVVKGTPNLKFAWEIKAKQKGYEYERLEKNQGASQAMEPDYEQQYMNEIEELIKKQEEMYYETA